MTSTEPRPPAPGDDRLPALDGLRGIAALIVLLQHVVFASVAPLGIAMVRGEQPDGVYHLLMSTPLVVFWAGSEFVIVFFVLSAFVLMRAAVRAGPGWHPGAYYAARLVRLYLPVWGSVALALVLVALVARPLAAALPNLTLMGYAAPVRSDTVVHALTLYRPYEAQLNGVLWSLRWEVLFSLTLPLLVAITPALRRQAPLLGVGALLAVWGTWKPGTITIAAPFAVGVALALREDAIARLRARLAGHRALTPVLLVAAAVLVTADAWMSGATRGAGLPGAMVVLGAALLVVAPLVDPRVERALLRAPVQWLGRRSYSFYLVHQPLVVALAFALGAPPFWILLPLSLAASLLVAAGFHRAVERPAQRLSRRAGRAVAARSRRRPVRAASLEPEPA